MKPKLGRAAVCAAIAIGVIAPSHAAPPADPKANGPMSGYSVPLSGQDLEKIENYNDANRAKHRAQAVKDAAILVAAIPLECDITDAEHIGRGKMAADGKTIDVDAYEIACSNHMGYFVESQGSQNPIAFSCFAVAAAHTADLKQGKKTNANCSLAANRDMKAATASLLQEVGTQCSVKEVRWFGVSAPTQSEYTEASCTDGEGYLLRIARTGASVGVSAMSCQDAAKQGLKCRLTNGGPVLTPLSMQTYRDALHKFGAACEPTQMRVIGRESEDKRYVVEMRCLDQSSGLVAFIPLEGNANQFELIDCTAAVELDIHCELAAPPDAKTSSK